MVDPKVDNLKFDASLHCKITPKTDTFDLFLSHVGEMDGVFQRGNKIKLDNVVVQNHQTRSKRKQLLLLKHILLNENTGDSYNVKPLADNLDLYTGGATDTKTPTSMGNKI